MPIDNELVIFIDKALSHLRFRPLCSTVMLIVNACTFAVGTSLGSLVS